MLEFAAGVSEGTRSGSDTACARAGLAINNAKIDIVARFIDHAIVEGKVVTKWRPGGCAVPIESRYWK